MLLAPAVADAHTLGNFTVNRFSRIEPAADGVRIVYVLDMAEIPAFQEQSKIDVDRDGRVSSDEHERYAASLAERVGRNLRLELNGSPMAPRLIGHALSFPPGQGGLVTLRLDAVYLADLPRGANGTVSLVLRDDNEPARIGWREMVARPGAADTEIRQASVPATDQSDELRTYPEDLLNSPLDVREARLTFVPGAASAGPLAEISGRVSERSKDVYAELVATDNLTPSTIVFLLLFAMVLGAQHALSPGHGKTVVAAYLVGARGTARHALFLGVTVTATHTLGVYALGLVTLYLSQYILPERLYPLLQVVSGLLVVGIGAWLFATRLGGALRYRRQAAQDQHGHDHAHDHADHPHEHPHDDDHHHSHSHGGRAHSHLPPGADGQKVSWRSLLALGISGGLLPCPSALVVLLSAISLHRVAFGLLLIVAFSIGLAAVLVGIGLLLVYARRVFQRFSVGGGFATRLLPAISALLIMVAGLVLTLQALPQMS